MEERWKPVKGYEEFYQVSNLGRVRSLPRRLFNGLGYFIKKGKVLKPYKDKDGYLVVGLRNSGHNKTAKIHRLVAEAFISNPHNLPQINHKNERRNDNRADNLEWCTNQYNLNYGNHNKKMSQTLRRIKGSKPVIQYSKSGVFQRKWHSLHQIERELGYQHGNISQCCKGCFKQAYGYVWKFESEVSTND